MEQPKRPTQPKSSKNQANIERQKQLKDRLRLNWQKPSVNVVKPHEVRNVTFSELEDHHEIKGYGERQFHDSYYDLNSSKGFETSKADDFLDKSKSKLSGFDTFSSINHSTLPDKSLPQDSHSHFKSKNWTSHLDMSQTLHDRGFQGMVDSFVTGETEFCYIEKLPADSYTFSIKTEFPSVIYGKDKEFTTVSAHGILKVSEEGSELISHKDFYNEKIINEKLKNIKVFQTFWKWKPFFLWRRVVRREKFERIKNIIEKSLLLADDLFRELIVEARVSLERLAKYPLIVFDLSKINLFQQFISTQRIRNEQFKELKAEVLESIVNSMCNKCEAFLLLAAEHVPPSVSQSKYGSIRAKNAYNPSSILNSAHTAKEIIEKGFQMADQKESLTNVRVEEANSSLIEDVSVKEKSRLRAFSNDNYDLNSSSLMFDASQSTIENKFYDQQIFEMNSIVSKIKEDENENIVPHSIMAAIRLKCRRLVNLFRFVDFMIRDYLYEALFQNIYKMYLTLENISLKNQPINAYESENDSDDEEESMSESSSDDDHDYEEGGLKKKLKSTSSDKSFKSLNLGEVLKKILATSENDRGQFQSTLFKISISFLNMVNMHSSMQSNRINVKISGVFFQNEDSSSSSILLCDPEKKYCVEEIQELLGEISRLGIYSEGLFFHRRCIKLFTPLHNELTFNSLEDRIFFHCHHHAYNNSADMSSDSENEYDDYRIEVREKFNYLSSIYDNRHNSLQQIIKFCSSVIRNNFHWIEKQLYGFENYIELYESTNEVIRKADITNLVGYSTDIIHHQLTKWDEDGSTIAANIPNEINVGIFRVELKEMKSSFLQKVSDGYDIFHKYIPDLYVSNGDRFFHEISTYIDKLSLRFQSLEDFVKVVEMYNKCSKIIEQLKIQYTYIDNIRDILDLRKIRISESVLRQNLTISTVYQKFNNIMGDFQHDILDVHLKVYRLEIQTRLKSLLSPIQEFQKFLLTVNTKLLVNYDIEQEEKGQNELESLINIDAYPNLESPNHTIQRSTQMRKSMHLLLTHARRKSLVVLNNDVLASVQAAMGIKSDVEVSDNISSNQTTSNQNKKMSPNDPNSQAAQQLLAELDIDIDFLYLIKDDFYHETKDHDTSVANILKKLTKFLADINSMSQKLNLLDQFQTILDISVFERGLENQVRELLESQILLWKSFAKVKDVAFSFMNMQFLDVQGQFVVKEMQKIKNDLIDHPYFKTLLASRISLVENHHSHITNFGDSHLNDMSHNNELGILLIYDKIMAKINEILDIIPLINQLQSHTLRASHISRIHRLLRFNIYEAFNKEAKAKLTFEVPTKPIADESTDISEPESVVISRVTRSSGESVRTKSIESVIDQQQEEEPERLMTVEELINVLSIQQYSEGITIIYYESWIQYNVQQFFSQNIEQKVQNNLVFEFESDIENKAFIFITNFLSLKRKITLVYDTLLLIRSSYYAKKLSSFYMDTLIPMIENIQGILEMLHNYEFFQQKYMQYRVLFSSTRINRQILNTPLPSIESKSQSMMIKPPEKPLPLNNIQNRFINMQDSNNISKSFKILDENWRNFIKQSKSYSKVFDLYLVNNQRQQALKNNIYFQIILSNIKVIENGMDYILDDLYEKYPKLYLISKKELVNLILLPNNLDLVSFFHYVKGDLFSSYHIQELIIDDMNIFGVISFEEKIVFFKHVSSRNNIADWLRNIESSVNDKFEKHISDLINPLPDQPEVTLNSGGIPTTTSASNNLKNLISYGHLSLSMLHSTLSSMFINDELKSLQFSEQSLLLFFQLKFWYRVTQIFTHHQFGSQEPTASDRMAGSSSAPTMPYPVPISVISNPIQLLSELQVNQNTFNQVLSDNLNSDRHINILLNLRSFHLELNDQINIIYRLIKEMSSSSNPNPGLNKNEPHISHSFEGKGSPSKTVSSGLSPTKDPKNLQKNLQDAINDKIKLVKTVSDFIVLIVYYRDVLQYMIDNDILLSPTFNISKYTEENPDSYLELSRHATSGLFCTIQKYIEPETGKIFSILGGVKEYYGMKYQGFMPRMVITPMVDKCFLAIHQAMRGRLSTKASAIPILSGPSSSVIVKALAYENGMELLEIDTSHWTHHGEDFASSLTNVVKVACKYGMWTALYSTMDYNGEREFDGNENHLSLNAVSMIGHTLTSLYQQLNIPSNQHPDTHLSLNLNGSQFCVNNDTKYPTFFLMNSTNKEGKFLMLSSWNHNNNNKNHSLDSLNLFRPVSLMPIPLKVILTGILTSFNFPFVSKIAHKLDGLVQYLTAYYLVPEKLLRKILISTIRHLGEENDHNLINNLTMQMNIIVKKLISSLPLPYQECITETELKLICNLYLEVVYNPETDYKEFYSLPENNSRSEQFLYEMLSPLLMSKLKMDVPYENRSVLVIGKVASGKSTLINNTIIRIQEETNKRKFYTEFDYLNIPGLNPLLDDDIMYQVYHYKNLLNSSMAIYSKKISSVPGFQHDFLPMSVLHSQIMQHVISEILNNVKKQRVLSTFHYIHVDFTTSNQMLAILPPLRKYLERHFPFHRIKLICESVESKQLDPSILNDIDIVYLREPIYSFQDYAERCFRNCVQFESLVFKNILEEYKDKVILPCIMHFPEDSLVNQHTLIHNVYTLISSLFHYTCYPPINGTTSHIELPKPSQDHKSGQSGMKYAPCTHFDQLTLKRIIIYSCIWTIGVSSASSRKSFENWFREYFKEDFEKELIQFSQAQQSLEIIDSPDVSLTASSASVTSLQKDTVNLVNFSRILPFFSPTISIFDCLLHKSENNSLEWTPLEQSILPPINKKYNPTIDMLFTDIGFCRKEAELFIPSVDTRILCHLQAAFSHNLPLNNRKASTLMIVGDKGNGKRTLLHQLLFELSFSYSSESKKLSHFESCRRWVYHTSGDSTLHNVQNNILSSQAKLTLYVHENNFTDHGAVFIEDVNILDSTIENNSIELIRYIQEKEAIFDVNNRELHPLPLFYSALSTTAPTFRYKLQEADRPAQHSTGDTLGIPQPESNPNNEKDDLLLNIHFSVCNHRFLRHTYLYHCTPSTINHVFSTYIAESFNYTVPEIMVDIANATRHFFNNLQGTIHKVIKCPEWHNITPFTPAQRLHLITFHAVSSNLWTYWVLTNLSSTLQTLTSLTTNEIVKVWDRILADFSNRYLFSLKLQDIFLNSYETAIMEGIYGLESFVGIVERERSMRFSNLESSMNSASPPKLDEAVSYTRNCTGFFRTGNGIFPSVFNTEYVKDFIYKKIVSLVTQNSENIEIQRLNKYWKKFKNSNNFWMDVLRLINLWAVNPLSGNIPSLVLIYNSSFALIHERVTLASLYNPSTNVQSVDLDLHEMQYFYYDQHADYNDQESLSIAKLEQIYDISSQNNMNTGKISNVLSRMKLSTGRLKNSYDMAQEDLSDEDDNISPDHNNLLGSRANTFDFVEIDELAGDEDGQNENNPSNTSPYDGPIKINYCKSHPFYTKYIQQFFTDKTVLCKLKAHILQHVVDTIPISNSETTFVPDSTDKLKNPMFDNNRDMVVVEDQWIKFSSTEDFEDDEEYQNILQWLKTVKQCYQATIPQKRHQITSPHKSNHNSHFTLEDGSNTKTIWTLNIKNRLNNHTLTENQEIIVKLHKILQEIQYNHFHVIARFIVDNQHIFNEKINPFLYDDVREAIQEFAGRQKFVMVFDNNSFYPDQLYNIINQTRILVHVIEPYPDAIDNESYSQITDRALAFFNPKSEVNYQNSSPLVAQVGIDLLTRVFGSSIFNASSESGGPVFINSRYFNIMNIFVNIVQPLLSDNSMPLLPVTNTSSNEEELSSLLNKPFVDQHIELNHNNSIFILFSLLVDFYPTLQKGKESLKKDHFLINIRLLTLIQSVLLWGYSLSSYNHNQMANANTVNRSFSILQSFIQEIMDSTKRNSFATSFNESDSVLLIQSLSLASIDSYLHRKWLLSPYYQDPHTVRFMISYYEKIWRLILMLPSDSSLKMWLLSFYYGLFTHKQIIIVDYTFLFSLMLNHLLNLNMSYQLNTMDVSHQRISWTIDTASILGNIPSLEANESNEKCSMVIARSDFSIVAELILLRLFLNPDNQLDNLDKSFSVLWKKKTGYINQLWKIYKEKIFDNLSELSGKNYQRRGSIVFSNSTIFPFSLEEHKEFDILWNQNLLSINRQIENYIFIQQNFIQTCLNCEFVEEHSLVLMLSLFNRLIDLLDHEITDVLTSHVPISKRKQKTDNKKYPYETISGLIGFIMAQLITVVIPNILTNPADYLMCLFNVVLDYFYFANGNDLTNCIQHRNKLTQALRGISLLDNLAQNKLLKKLDIRYGIVRREKYIAPMKLGENRKGKSDNNLLSEIIAEEDEEDEDSNDDESRDRRTSNAFHEGNNNISETYILSDGTRSILKSSLTAISNYFNSGIIVPGSNTFYERYSSVNTRQGFSSIASTLIHPSSINLQKGAAFNNNSIIISIDKYIDDWMEWVADKNQDIQDIPLQNKSQMQILDQLVLVMLFKPSLLLSFLFSTICEVGLGLKYDDIRAHLTYSFTSSASNQFFDSILHKFNVEVLSGRFDDRRDYSSYLSSASFLNDDSDTESQKSQDEKESSDHDDDDRTQTTASHNSSALFDLKKDQDTLVSRFPIPAFYLQSSHRARDAIESLFSYCHLPQVQLPSNGLLTPGISYFPISPNATFHNITTTSNNLKINRVALYQTSIQPPQVTNIYAGHDEDHSALKQYYRLVLSSNGGVLEIKHKQLRKSTLITHKVNKRRKSLTHPNINNVLPYSNIRYALASFTEYKGYHASFSIEVFFLHLENLIQEAVRHPSLLLHQLHEIQSLNEDGSSQSVNVYRFDYVLLRHYHLLSYTKDLTVSSSNISSSSGQRIVIENVRDINALEYFSDRNYIIEASQKLLTRMKWLLILFHIALHRYFLSLRRSTNSNHSHAGSDSSIGEEKVIHIETLLFALDNLETLWLNILNSTFEAYYEQLHEQMQTAKSTKTNLNQNETQKDPNVPNTRSSMMQNQPLLSSKIEASKNKPSPMLDILLFFATNLLEREYIEPAIFDGVYYPLLLDVASCSASKTDYSHFKSIFDNIFAPNSCNYRLDYLLLNQVQIPNNFEPTEIRRFLKEILGLMLEEEEGHGNGGAGSGEHCVYEDLIYCNFNQFNNYHLLIIEEMIRKLYVNSLVFDQTYVRLASFIPPQPFASESMRVSNQALTIEKLSIFTVVPAITSYTLPSNYDNKRNFSIQLNDQDVDTIVLTSNSRLILYYAPNSIIPFIVKRLEHIIANLPHLIYPHHYEYTTMQQHLQVAAMGQASQAQRHRNDSISSRQNSISISRKTSLREDHHHQLGEGTDSRRGSFLPPGADRYHKRHSNVAYNMDSVYRHQSISTSNQSEMKLDIKTTLSDNGSRRSSLRRGSTSRRSTLQPSSSNVNLDPSYSGKRRMGQQLQNLRFQSREYDVLWSYLLQEIYDFNKSIISIRNYLANLLTIFTSFSHYSANDSSLLRRYIQAFHGKLYSNKEMDPAEERSLYSDFISSIFTGHIPLLWYSDFSRGFPRKDTGFLQHVTHLNQSHIVHPSSQLASFQSSICGMSQDLWFQTLQDRYHLLHTWLKDGNPPPIKIYLLSNPQGLIYSMKEYYADLMSTSSDKIYMNFQLIPGFIAHGTSVKKNPVGATSRRGSKQGQQAGSEIVFDISRFTMKFIHTRFSNALFSGRTKSLEFIPNYHSSTFGSEVVVELILSLENKPIEEESYNCPFYIPKNGNLPHSSYLLTRSEAATGVKKPIQVVIEESEQEESPIFHIPVSTSEDIAECASNRIALYSAPIWMLPK